MWRDRVAVNLVNLVLQTVATRHCRDLIAGAIQYGMNAAARDSRENSEPPAGRGLPDGTRRDDLAIRLMHAILRTVATRHYRDFVLRLIEYGMGSAYQDTRSGRPVPPDWESVT